MTIEDAITHAREVADKKYKEGFLCCANSVECEKEHEQLAEWLEELQQYKAIETEMKDHYHANVDIRLLMQYFIETIFKGEKHEKFCILTNEDAKMWEEYQKIGTVEKYQELSNDLKSKENYINQILWERDVAIQQLEEVGASLGGKMDFIKDAIEKQKAKEAEHFIKKYGKHKWKTAEDGETNEFGWKFGYHNGVSCERCGKKICVCCNPDYDELEDCEEEYWTCPNCGERIYSKNEYCKCGQHLKWSDDD